MTGFVFEDDPPAGAIESGAGGVVDISNKLKKEIDKCNKRCEETLLPRICFVSKYKHEQVQRV
jgi:hypothetical protein